jgi:hypothetical protein
MINDFFGPRLARQVVAQPQAGWLTPAEAAGHVLARLSFGPAPGQVAELARAG